MKATYTYSEATEFIKSVLTERIGGNSFIVVELIPNANWDGQIANLLRQSDCLDGLGNVRADRKIQSIKTLRQWTSDNQKELGFYPMGLADSKYCVENWDRFLKFLRANSRLPLENCCNNGLK